MSPNATTQNPAAFHSTSFLRHATLRGHELPLRLKQLAAWDAPKQRHGNKRQDLPPAVRPW